MDCGWRLIGGQWVKQKLVTGRSNTDNGQVWSDHVPNYHVPPHRLFNPRIEPLNSTPNWKIRIGVKVFPYDVQTRETLVIKDKDPKTQIEKPWDEVGGGLDGTETPIEALFREIKEETGQEMVSAAQFIYLGVSDYVDEVQNEVGRTHIYICPMYLFNVTSQFRRVNPWLGPLNDEGHEEGFQPWHKRNLETFLTKLGAPEGAAAILKANNNRESPLRLEVDLTTPYVAAWITALNSGKVNLNLDAMFTLGQRPMSLRDLQKHMVARGYTWDFTGLDTRYYKKVKSSALVKWEAIISPATNHTMVLTPRGADFVMQLGLPVKYVFLNGQLEEMHAPPPTL